MDANDAVPKETVDKVREALTKRGFRPEGITATLPAKAPEAPAAPAPAAPAAPVTPAEDTRPRDAQGRFQAADGQAKPADPAAPAAPAKPEQTPAERGLLAAVRAEREKRKALEAEVAELRNRKPEAPPAPRKRDELLNAAPAETRDFWNKIADPVIREVIQEAVAAEREKYAPAVERFEAQRRSEEEARKLADDAIEFAEDMALEGVPVDPAALLGKIQQFESQYDISLGSTNRKKFENAVGMLGVSQARNAPAETPEQAKARADKEAADKARAGGVAPGSAATVPPPDTRAATQRTVRELAMKGDDRSIATIIAQRTQKHPRFGV